jgi:hypothetical protein
MSLGASMMHIFSGGHPRCAASEKDSPSEIDAIASALMLQM